MLKEWGWFSIEGSRGVVRTCHTEVLRPSDQKIRVPSVTSGIDFNQLRAVLCNSIPSPQLEDKLNIIQTKRQHTVQDKYLAFRDLVALGRSWSL